MDPISTIIYSAAFLSEDSHKKILQAFPPKFQNVHAHHMTITYKPSLDEIKSLKIGEKITLKIIGIAEDDKAQALVIKTLLPTKNQAHITLSTAQDVAPVYSNELITKGFKKCEVSLEVEATVGVFDGVTEIITQTPIKNIILPTRSQIDTIIAIAILKKCGWIHFSGIADASYEILTNLPEGVTPEFLLQHGDLCLDVGKGTFDHHGRLPQTTASDLVSEFLHIKEHSALQKVLEFARRDDFFGKGIISTDALDRAFGLPGLVVNLNKKYTSQPTKVIEIILPLIDAHIDEEIRRTEEMPKEVEEKIASGKANVYTVKQHDKKLRCIFIESDNISLPGFLRSQLGGRHDVVLQRLPSGHTNILTRPTKRIDLRNFVATLRRAELMKAQNPKLLPAELLRKEGRIDDVKEWYYDPATNSIQNGGVKPEDTPPTRLSKVEIISISELGLQ